MQGIAIESAGEQQNWKAESAKSFDALAGILHVLNYLASKLVLLHDTCLWLFISFVNLRRGKVEEKYYPFLLIMSWCSLVAVEKTSTTDSIYELQNIAHQRHSAALQTWYGFGIT